MNACLSSVAPRHASWYPVSRERRRGAFRLARVMALLPGFLCLLTAAAPADDDTAREKPKLAVRAGKVITSAGPPITDGVILVADGKIQAVGTAAEIDVPADYTLLDCSQQFAMPGLIDAHSHVGGSGDINEMVYQTNPELRIWDQIIPHNDRLKRAVAGGVTTVCFIPGSGTNMGGWGALMKTGPGRLDEVLIKAPGVLKIAQSGNPERYGGEVGSGRMGMNHIIRQQLREGQLYVRQWDDWEAGRRAAKPRLNLRLEYFSRCSAARFPSSCTPRPTR